jgi:hypothetical protein
MGFFTDERVGLLMTQVSMLSERIEKLEKETKYIADQPKGIADTPFAWELARNAYASGINLNEVPITDVVKAIVKHLGMEIEKVPEQTTKKPQEVKVVEKQPSVTITGADGLGATWANVAPMPKPKRKRKTK